MNKNSENYIGRRIGTKYVTWSDKTKRYTEYGDYDNVSDRIRIEVNKNIPNTEMVPFGVYGHPRFKGFYFHSASAAASAIPNETNSNIFVQGSGSATAGLAFWAGKNTPGGLIDGSAVGKFAYVGTGTGSSDYEYNATCKFPAARLRSSSFDGDLSSPRDAYWGVDTTQTTNTVFERSNLDITRAKPKDIDSYDASSANGTEDAWVFTLDDIRPRTNSSTGHAIYTSGSRDAGTSYTAVSASYKGVLDNEFDRFTTMLHGGYDGVDSTEREPFRNRILSDGTERSNYAFYSIKKAIDTLSDVEEVEFNIAAAPGLTHEGLTGHLVNTCESRGDALAIIDVKGGYEPIYESKDGESSRRSDVDTVVTNMRDRGLNSSYGCAYYPWVQIRDTVGGQFVWVPPSVVALGAMSYAQRNSELWFAPAGFTRGGLSERGAAGLPVVGVREKLTSVQRDKLYEANINPIASFPAEGIVIFGQKTLQVTRSALDRINVRRLMIYIKKEISNMAATVLFDQNVQATWKRFLGKANPFLRGVQSGLGLTDYKIVLDETTTTPDLVDRNIMYAKIFLKPARSIEYIALDFVITNTGASFED